MKITVTPKKKRTIKVAPMKPMNPKERKKAA